MQKGREIRHTLQQFTPVVEQAVDGLRTGLAVGAMLFGLGMAGWMTPLSVLRRETPPARMAWRTALYRVGVDGGIFLGPVLGGLVANRHLGVVAAALAVLGIGLLHVDRARAVVPERATP